MGTKYVVQAIEDKMKSEVCPYNDLDFNAVPTSQEERFLSKLEKMKLTEDEKINLLRPTNDGEISEILNEVDLDSSPGEDGITYRFIKLFWEWKSYRE